MTTQVIVLNGGSSSGRTGIARCLQAILPDPWIRVGIEPGGTTIGPQGSRSATRSGRSRRHGRPAWPPWPGPGRA